MSVALDATPLLGERTGVGAFCAGALEALGRRPELDVAGFAVSWRRRHELDHLLPSDLRSAQRPMPARPLHFAWSHLSGPPVEWFIGPVDVVHGTNYVVPPTRRAARVVTVHDLTALRYPQLCDSPSLAFPRLVRRAAASGAWVHTPSQFVAEEVVAELGIDPSRVRAVHHGIPGRDLEGGTQTPGDRRASDPRRVDRRASELRLGDQRASDPRRGDGTASVGLPDGATRYVLAVGTVEPRKDYPSLVRAFDILTEKVGDVALVIAGGYGWGASALDDVLGTLRQPERIVRLGYVSPERLDRLFAGAEVVACPSVYEGFGFVPLEAMAAGVPVVATAVGAIPEVVGDGALLVAPGDVEALAAALVTALGDEGVRADLVERGRSRASSFTWDACAEGLADLYAAAAR